ncbi:MAG: RIP metalloprotease RseP [Endomicrobiia bacterium]
MFISAISIIFTFGIIIFLHELGHFIIARAQKVRVEKFAFGFGPEIFGKTIGPTRYSICIFPLGGMVKLAGEQIEEIKGEKDEFFSKPWYSRIFIVGAGPFMNYVLAMIFFFITIFFWGIGTPSNKPIIGEIRAGMPAERAGLKPGDIILTIDGEKIQTWQDMASIIHKKGNQKTKIEIKREDKVLVFELIPEIDRNLKIGLIGIMPEVKVEKVGILKSFLLSIEHTIAVSIVYIQYILEKIMKLEKPEVAGPIGIAQIVAQTAKTGLSSLLILIGRISVMVGLLNLFPIPLFDGGHIMFYTIEGLITKKPASKKVLEIANFIGLVIIISIFLFAFYSDFQRLGFFSFFKIK